MDPAAGKSSRGPDGRAAAAGCRTRHGAKCPIDALHNFSLIHVNVTARHLGDGRQFMRPMRRTARGFAIMDPVVFRAGGWLALALRALVFAALPFDTPFALHLRSGGRSVEKERVSRCRSSCSPAHSSQK